MLLPWLQSCLGTAVGYHCLGAGKNHGNASPQVEKAACEPSMERAWIPSHLRVIGEGCNAIKIQSSIKYHNSAN